MLVYVAMIKLFAYFNTHKKPTIQTYVLTGVTASKLVILFFTMTMIQGNKLCTIQLNIISFLYVEGGGVITTPGA